MANVRLIGGPLDGQWAKAVPQGSILQDGCTYERQGDGTWVYSSGEPKAAKPLRRTARTRTPNGGCFGG